MSGKERVSREVEETRKAMDRLYQNYKDFEKTLLHTYGAYAPLKLLNQLKDLDRKQQAFRDKYRDEITATPEIYAEGIRLREESEAMLFAFQQEAYYHAHPEERQQAN